MPINKFISSIANKFKGKQKPKDKPDPDAEPPRDDSPQVAPEGAPDESLNVDRAIDLIVESRGAPREGITKMRRPEGGNLNLQALEDDADMKEIALLLSESQDMYKSRKSRKPVSTEKTVKMSEDIRVMNRAVQKPWDSSWTHEEIMALGQLNKRMTVKLKEAADQLAEGMASGEVSRADEIAFAYIEQQAIAVQQKMVDAAAASGRGLQTFQKLKGARNSAEYQEITREIIEFEGGAEALRERIRMYAQGQTLEEIYAAKNASMWEKTKQAIMTVRYNMMLSSIRTHTANISGSAFFSVYENLFIKPLQVGFNRLETGIRGVAPKFAPVDSGEIMAWREAWALDNVALQAVKDGWNKGWRVFLGREADVGPTKLSVEGPGRRSYIRTPKSKTGKVLTYPTRALEAEDAAFRTVNARMEMSRLVFREAKELSETAEEAADLYKEYMQHPPEHLRRQAQNFGERSVFIQDSSLDSRLLAGVANMVASGQQKYFPIQVLVPFVRTPANLLIYAKNNLGLSSRMVTDYFSQGPIRRAEINARLTGAMGLYYLTRNMYENGDVTGLGNPNHSIARAEKVMGMNPTNSVRVGNKWYQLNRLDPGALMLGMMATLHEQIDYYEGQNQPTMEALIPTMLKAGELMLDRSMLSSITDLMQVVQDRAGAGTEADVLANLAVLPSLVTPGIARDVRLMHDPSMRKMESEGKTLEGYSTRIQKRWLNAIPGLSNNMPPKRDWRGEIKNYQGNWFWRSIVPVSIHAPMTDKSSLALAQFGVSPPKVGVKFVIPKTGVTLNVMAIDGGQGWAHDRLDKMIGEARAKEVDKLVNSSYFKRTRDKALKDGVVIDQYYYDELSYELSRAMSDGRADGIYDFLDWIDGRAEIPGPEGKSIKVEQVIKEDDYMEFVKSYEREGVIPESEIYSIPKRQVSPGTEAVINEANIDF